VNVIGFIPLPLSD
jgi:F-type H+-transporting ATPase subunit a